jgi:antitoxin component YwqK of YwqJK toxin-antitoxin module
MKNIFSSFFLLLLACQVSAQSPDTIYYNEEWQITAARGASYYRIAKIELDSALKYVGNAKDYYINDTLEMEGFYNADGLRAGKFSFYYPDGKLKCAGAYLNGVMFGFWDYYYPEGGKKATLNFPGGNNEFSFLEFYDSLGHQTLKEGTGKFYWNWKEGLSKKIRVEGEFANEQRAGTWTYHTNFGKFDVPTHKEIYENGKLKKGVQMQLNKTVKYDQQAEMTFDEEQLYLIEEFNFSPVMGLNKAEPTVLYKFLTNKGDKETSIDDLVMTSGFKREDTIFYNNSWQICESPFAEYYRIGKVRYDSGWIYDGHVKDYYATTGKMQMEGFYDNDGRRNGTFTFYLPDGKLQSKREFDKGHMAGVWEYYYENGKKMAVVDFRKDSLFFIVNEYYDIDGKQLCKNGDGYFELPVYYPFRNGSLTLKGFFTRGRRSGVWKFYADYRDYKDLAMKETYDNNGQLVKGILYSRFDRLSEYAHPCEIIPGEVKKFLVTESFIKDPTAFPNFYKDKDIADLLINKQGLKVDITGKSTGESFNKLLSKLNSFKVRGLFKDYKKFYDAYIEFNVNDSGQLKSIYIKGNLSPKETADLLFVLQKMENMYDSSKAVFGTPDRYMLYFYTVDIHSVVPSRFRNVDQMNKISFFSMVAKEDIAELIRKGMKKFFRIYWWL